jgi:hypothetical protein
MNKPETRTQMSKSSQIRWQDTSQRAKVGLSLHTPENIALRVVAKKAGKELERQQKANQPVRTKEEILAIVHERMAKAALNGA